jgi:hypothetical protein
MPRLPQPGADALVWGDVLNEFLRVEHGSNGSLKLRTDGTLDEYYKKPAAGIPQSDLSVSLQSDIAYASTVLNVKKYGAFGNGSTDDTAAIQTAIDALPEAGGQVFIPSGTYVISSSLVLAEGVQLVGTGPGSILRVASGSLGIDVIQIGDGSGTVSFASVCDIKISSDGQKTGGAAIKMTLGYRVWIERVALEYQYRGVYMYNSTAIWLQNSDIRDTTENAITIESDYMQGFEWYITNVLCDNPTVTNVGSGLYWDGGESLRVTQSNFQRFATGFMVAPSDGRESRFAFIDGMLCDFASDNNVKVTNSGSGAAIGITFSNSWSGTATNYGILMERPGAGLVQGLRWTGGKVFHNGLAGFRLAGGLDMHISNTDIIANSQTVSAARHGVEVGAGVGDFSVQNCRIGGGYQQGDTQGYAIHIDAGGSDHYMITGNDCHGNNNTPKIDDNGTGVNKVVANNLEA